MTLCLTQLDNHIPKTEMAIAAPELQMHISAGEKAAPQEIVDFVKEKGVASLKVSFMVLVKSIVDLHSVHFLFCTRREYLNA